MLPSFTPISRPEWNSLLPVTGFIRLPKEDVIIPFSTGFIITGAFFSVYMVDLPIVIVFPSPFFFDCLCVGLSVLLFRDQE